MIRTVAKCMCARCTTGGRASSYGECVWVCNALMGRIEQTSVKCRRREKCSMFGVYVLSLGPLLFRVKDLPCFVRMVKSCNWC